MLHAAYIDVRQRKIAIHKDCIRVISYISMKMFKMDSEDSIFRREEIEAHRADNGHMKKTIKWMEYENGNGNFNGNTVDRRN